MIAAVGPSAELAPEARTEAFVFHTERRLVQLTGLRARSLGELAAIDLREFTTIRQLREAILALLDERLAQPSGREKTAPPGDEFHFCRSKSFVIPTGIVARDVPEFFAVLPRVTNISFSFHFLEARLRLERPTNDFSQWLLWRGQADLAAAIDALDPYTRTLDELKAEVLAMGRRRGYC